MVPPEIPGRERVRGVMPAIALLSFDIAGQRFALSARVVREVAQAVAVTPLPKAPPIIEGVINYRGTLVPLLGLRQRFGLDPLPLSPDQHFLFAQTRARLVALRVDRAVELLAVDEDGIEPAELVAPGAEYVAGLAKLPDGLLIIQDLERFLSLDEAEQVDLALAGATA